MKKFLYISSVLIGAALFGCTDLDLIPEDTVTPESYFSNETELRLWTNAYYAMLPDADDLNDMCADDVVKNILSNVLFWATGFRPPRAAGIGATCAKSISISNIAETVTT